MDDRLKESISALLDDEADELELRRVLAHGRDDEVNEQWRRYQQIHQMMDGKEENAFQGVDVSASVMAAIRGEVQSDSVHPEPGRYQESEPNKDTASLPTTHRHQTETQSRRWMWGAVAASVASIAMSMSWFSATYTDPVVASHKVPVVHQIESLSSEQVQVVSQYLLRHAEYSGFGFRQGMLPLARVASSSAVDS